MRDKQRAVRANFDELAWFVRLSFVDIPSLPQLVPTSGPGRTLCLLCGYFVRCRHARGHVFGANRVSELSRIQDGPRYLQTQINKQFHKVARKTGLLELDSATIISDLLSTALM